MPSQQQYTVDPQVMGWLLLALREAMGDPVVRNAILQKEVGTPRGVEFGKTFEYGFTLKQLEDYLDALFRKRGVRYLLFTAQNLPDKRSRETHYQAYIVDYRRHHVWIMDPARTPSGKGIYHPFISNDIIIPFFTKHGWKAEFVPTTSACQRGLRDVFCQSWSLFLQIEFVKMLLTLGHTQALEIPSRKEVRNQLLVDFFQRALSVPAVCDQVTTSYQHLICTHRDLVAGVSSVQEKKAIRESFLQFSPCRLLMKMNVYDLD